jgi:hypothetical protein
VLGVYQHQPIYGEVYGCWFAKRSKVRIKKVLRLTGFDEFFNYFFVLSMRKQKTKMKWISLVEVVIYDNAYASIIDIYFYEFFQPSQTSST